MPTLSFQKPLPDLAFAKPKALRLGAATYETATWAKVLEETARAMLDGARTRKAALAAAKRLPWMGRSGRGMARPCELEPSVWIELHQGSHGILVRTKMLLEACSYPLDHATLEYETVPSSKKGKIASSSRMPRPAPRSDNPLLSNPVQPTLFGPQTPMQPALFDPTSKRKPSVPEKIGAYAKRMLFQALAEKGRIPDEDFKALQTTKGTKALLGISLTTCPLFSLSPMIRRDGGRGSWIDPATHDGKPVYVNSQWYEEHRPKLDRLLARWNNGNTVTPKTNQDAGIESNLAELMEAEFPNGVRPGDFIDQRKLRKFYKAYFGTDLPADFAFATILPRLGIVHDGKVFPRPSEKEGGWRKFIDDLAAQGHRLFQFSRVMQRHAKELMRLGVTSSEMLREVMSKSALDAYEIKDDFFIAKAVPPRDAIPADAVLVEEKDLAKNLPYVDEEWIRNLLRNTSGTIRNSPGVWAFSDRIAFDEDEATDGRRECAAAVMKDGFFSLPQLRLENSAAMNDRRLAEGTLRRAFFQRFLSGDFALKGQIVCRKGEEADSRLPLRVWCRTHSEVSLAEIESLAEDCKLAGWFAIATAYEEMVRVSRDRFVSPRLVDFDTAAVDEAVAARCVGGATPLCEFAGFSDFPAVPGFVWNDFLFESFLRRESRRYRIFSASSAAKDASGAVAEKSAPFADASSAFAAAALAGGVDPEPEAVGDFLVASRCALRRGRELVAAVVSAMHSQKRSRK